MSWFKIIKAPRDLEEPDQNWYHESWAQLPNGLKDEVYNIGLPAPKSAYTGMQIRRIELDDNGWKPRLSQRPVGLMGMFGVWDTDNNKMITTELNPTDVWNMQTHTFQAAGVGTEYAKNASGQAYMELKPHWIGIHLTHYNRPIEEGHPQADDMTLKVIMGKDSKWLKEGRKGEVEFFTNKEAAVLGIFAYYPKKKKEMMKDFGLGGVVIPENKLLQDLVDRGFFRVEGREQFKGGEVVRATPIINDRGKAAAPYLPPPNFNTVFRREVIQKPDEPFFSSNLGHWTGPKGQNVGVEEDEEGNVKEGEKFHLDPHPKEQGGR